MDNLCGIPGCTHIMAWSEDTGKRFCRVHIRRIERLLIARTHWDHEIGSAIEATTQLEARIRTNA